jgi:hypothetical protein
MKLVGIRHGREIKIMAAATAINPNPIVATRIAN